MSCQLSFRLSRAGAFARPVINPSYACVAAPLCLQLLAAAAAAAAGETKTSVVVVVVGSGGDRGGKTFAPPLPPDVCPRIFVPPANTIADNCFPGKGYGLEL